MDPSHSWESAVVACAVWRQSKGETSRRGEKLPKVHFYDGRRLAEGSFERGESTCEGLIGHPSYSRHPALMS